MSIGFPNDVLMLLNKKKYAEAIDMCTTLGINSSSIRDMVRDMTEAAKAAYENKEYKASIDIFIDMIGAVEPSVILCYFNKPHLTNHLTAYLYELQKRGYANEQHTRLLFNLFHHTEERKRLRDFVEMLKKAKHQYENPQPVVVSKKGMPPQRQQEDLVPFFKNFKAAAAIETLNDNDLNDEAFEIANIIGMPTYTVSILVNAQKQYVQAAKIISDHQNEEVGKLMLMEFGPELLAHNESAQFIVITAFLIWTSQEMDIPLSEDVQFMKLFWGSPPTYMKQFLEQVINVRPTTLFVNSYIELLIPRQASEYFGRDNAADQQKALKTILDSSIQIDDIDHLLLICREAGFKEGIVALLERNRRYSDIINFYLANGLYFDLFEFVSHDPELDGSDWFRIFKCWLQVTKDYLSVEQIELCKKLFTKSLEHVPLFTLIDMLCKNPNIPFEVVQRELNIQITNIVSDLEKEEELHQQLSLELCKIESDIINLEENNIEFVHTECSQCGYHINDVPYVGFFCGHNLHAHCCETTSDGDIMCPICRCPNSIEKKNRPHPLSINLDQNGDVIDPIITLINNDYFVK